MDANVEDEISSGDRIAENVHMSDVKTDGTSLDDTKESQPQHVLPLTGQEGSASIGAAAAHAGMRAPELEQHNPSSNLELATTEQPLLVRGPMTPPGEPLTAASAPGSSTPPLSHSNEPTESSDCGSINLRQDVISESDRRSLIPTTMKVTGPSTPPEDDGNATQPSLSLSAHPVNGGAAEMHSGSPSVLSAATTAFNSPQSFSIPSSAAGLAVSTTQLSSVSRTAQKVTPQRDSECETNGVDLNKSNEHIETTTKGDKTLETREVHDAKRKFRIVGLAFPGKWMNHEKLLQIFAKSESFHIWFDKAEKLGGAKWGGVSMVFENADEAKAAFASVQKMTLDGVPFKLQASRHFYGGTQPSGSSGLSAAGSSSFAMPPLPFKVDASEADSPRRLYALHLTPSTDQTLLSSILGSESIESILLETDPNVPSERQAEIVFRTAEEANDARIELADGFEIDEGDHQYTMVLLTAEEYLAYMKNGNERAAAAAASQRTTRSASPPVSASQSNAQSTSSPFVPAPQITVEDVTDLLQKYVDDTRTNWAELNEVGDLWRLCDEVSHQMKGLPDSMLKPALLNVLERHQKTLPSHWMRQHVDDLIKIWKREVQSAKSAPRSTAFMMSSVAYSPPRRTCPRRTAPNDVKKHELAMMMGMGAVLNTARSKLATEEGELDIDEDEHGNYSIGGQPLTFESWAEITKPPSPVVEARPRMLPEYRKIRNQHKKEIRERKMEEAKIQKMREAVESSKELEEEKQAEESKEPDLIEEGSITGPEMSEKKRELEEGEMSSESSSASSPSTSSDDEHSQHTSRDRRRKRRTQKKQARGTSQFPLGSQSPHFEALFKQLYEHRHSLLRSLSANHKHGFAAVLNQILSSPQGMTRAQHDQMAVFMRTFSAQNFHGK